MRKLRTFGFLSFVLFSMCLTSCGSEANPSTDNNNTNNTEPNTPTENVPEETKETCSVYFYSGAGHFANGETSLLVTVEKGEKVSKPENPILEGYTLESWMCEGEQWSFVGYVVTSDLILNAKWTPSKYAISFDTDGGESIPDLSVTYDASYTLPTASKEGYSFTGWMLDGEQFANEGTWKMASNCELKASYDPSVNLSAIKDSEGNECGSVSGSGFYKAGTNVTITATANEGYKFDGWYDNDELVSKEASYTFEMPKESLYYNAKFIFNTYEVILSSDHPYSGTLTGAGEHEYKSTVIVETTENAGYTFIGWYLDGNKVSSSKRYSFEMPNHNVSLEARFSAKSYTLALSTSNKNDGTVSGDGTFAVGETVTVLATPTIGRELNGWYDGDTLVSTDREYTFIMPAKNLNLIAKFELGTYKISLYCENSTVQLFGEGSYQYGLGIPIEIILPYDIESSEKLVFDGWYLGDKLLSKQPKTGITNPCVDATIEAKVHYECKGCKDKISLGRYPQSKVTDSTILENLLPYEQYLKTDDNLFQRVQYNFYYDSSYETGLTDKKDSWYLDVDLNSDGVNDYRGVYYTEFNSRKESESGYEINTVYWFKYEPIIWRILTNADNNFFVLSDKVIDNASYNREFEHETETRTDYQGNTASVYFNNYKYSEIRSFLNTKFYDTAFTEAEKDRILITEVDNSPSTSTRESKTPSEYFCENTFDKIFLLSSKEASNKNYGFDENPNNNDRGRLLEATDYARCIGVDAYDHTGTGLYAGMWYLRTPGEPTFSDITFAYNSGFINCYECRPYFGTAPAMHIKY